MLSVWEGRQNVLYGGAVRFHLDNYDDPQPIKRVQVQVTYWSEYSYPSGFGVRAYYEGSPDPVISQHEAVLVDSMDPDANGWVTAAYEFTIEQNPLEEDIHIEFTDLLGYPEASAYMDEVTIDTWCTVPEPATVGLLLIGGLALLMRRSQKG